VVISLAPQGTEARRVPHNLARAVLWGNSGRAVSWSAAPSGYEGVFDHHPVEILTGVQILAQDASASAGSAPSKA